MRVLIVCSGNSGSISPFIKEQTIALEGLGVSIGYFVIKGKGVLGYFKNFPLLKEKIIKFNPDLVHAHYGLSGLLSIFQFKKPVIVTFHNGEILSNRINLLASLVPLFSKYDIYVAGHIYNKMFLKKTKNYVILPCGIDFTSMREINQQIAKNNHLIDLNKINILFGGAFENERKNCALAKEAISFLKEFKINLIELKGLSREEVCQLLNACDLALLPSKSEGSPQFIKEAMACNCPVVATDVGDIKDILADTEGCFITSFNPKDVADKIDNAIKFGKRTNGRSRIGHFDNKLIGEKILTIYKKVVSDN